MILKELMQLMEQSPKVDLSQTIEQGKDHVFTKEELIAINYIVTRWPARHAAPSYEGDTKQYVLPAWVRKSINYLFQKVYEEKGEISNQTLDPYQKRVAADLYNFYYDPRNQNLRFWNGRTVTKPTNQLPEDDPESSHEWDEKLQKLVPKRVWDKNLQKWVDRRKV